jgi:RHS repeat-associated protein
MTTRNPNSQIIAQHDGSYSASRYFYLHDRLGSVRMIIDTSANVVNYYTYEPFGQTIESGGTLNNPFMFTGQYFDSEINEYYLRNRQYHPHIGRFTTRDLIAGQFDNPLSLHKYLYCENEPVNWIDPWGLWRAGLHNIIIDEVFDNLSNEDRAAMKRGSAWVDEFWVNQDPMYAYRHAMRNGLTDQSVESAQEEMYAYINGKLQLYEYLEHIGKKEDAYYYLGMALHPLMDMYCPTHEGFQKWYGVSSTSSLGHWWGEQWEFTEERKQGMIFGIEIIMEMMGVDYID